MLYSKNEIEEIFYRFSINNPVPKGDLYYTNPFTLLIAVLLSAQATDISVNKATDKLFKKTDNVYDMNNMSIFDIENHIRTIGLWRNKAKNIKSLCEILIRDYNGQIPQDRNLLMKLPGVGRKTANVVSNIAFGAPYLAVDTHIFRIANRTKLAPGKTPIAVEKQLVKIIPEQYLKNSHLWLVLHGRYICKARVALCKTCFINNLCRAEINPYQKK